MSDQPLFGPLLQLAEAEHDNQALYADLISDMRDGYLRYLCHLILTDDNYARWVSSKSYKHPSLFDKLVLGELALPPVPGMDMPGRVMQFRVHLYHPGSHENIERAGAHGHRFPQQSDMENGIYSEVTFQVEDSPSPGAEPCIELITQSAGSTYLFTPTQPGPRFLAPKKRSVFTHGGRWTQTPDQIHFIVPGLAPPPLELPTGLMPRVTMSFFLDPGYVTDKTYVYRNYLHWLRQQSDNVGPVEEHNRRLSVKQVRYRAQLILHTLDNPWRPTFDRAQEAHFAESLTKVAGFFDEQLSSPTPSEQLGVQLSMMRRSG